jgi:hypothetical protein
LLLRNRDGKTGDADWIGTVKNWRHVDHSGLGPLQERLDALTPA